MGREVAESCVDGLLIEMVSAYCDRFYATKPELAARRIEAIGYQVGLQLSERTLDSKGGQVLVLQKELPWESKFAISDLGFVSGGSKRRDLGEISVRSREIRITERYAMERPRFTDNLEAIKFICKEFWSELFKKQIDNLKTNHRGTFVLQDNRFRWLTRISIDQSPESLDTPQIDSSTLSADNKAAQATSMHLYFPCGIIRGALSNLGIPCAVSADTSNLPACSFVVRIKA
ncbi:hypothetical protein Taro_037225 [Colocasia esculenta]|uniref:Trafficking protein particle complex subunit 6B n=1 Tax=Colocasia esculenta TaxID=4460 RepID=A0A843WFN2_COLES|nr:hypothetical protein [Colocasia esculenta]